MTKAALMQYVGKRVFVFLKSSRVGVCGTLGYADEFSAKHEYRKPNCFYIGDRSFRVSNVTRFRVIFDMPIRKEQND